MDKTIAKKSYFEGPKQNIIKMDVGIRSNEIPGTYVLL